MKNTINKTIMMWAALACMVSCEFLEPEWVTPIALGSKQAVIELPSNEPGDNHFDIVSNCEYNLSVIQGADWIKITNKAQREIAFSYTQNNGFKRSAMLEISAPGRVDSLMVCQPGAYNEYIRIPDEQQSFNVDAQGAWFNVDFSTNVLFKDLKYEARSTQIDNVQLSKNSVSFEVLPTTSRDDRTFTLSVYTLDGWGQRVEAIISIKQSKYQ